MKHLLNPEFITKILILRNGNYVDELEVKANSIEEVKRIVRNKHRSKSILHLWITQPETKTDLKLNIQAWRY